MGVFNRDEHSKCQYYTFDYRVGFRHYKYAFNEIIRHFDASQSVLYFIISGRINVSFLDFKDRIFCGGEMMFIPKYQDYTACAMEDVEILKLVYDRPLNICDKNAMEDLSPYRQDLVYDFRGLKIHDRVMVFVRQVIDYLEDGMDCSRLHQIKMMELFLLIRGYYTREEKAMFFYHAIAGSLDFREAVMSNYKMIKNVQSFANTCGLSLTDFNRKFKAEFKDTPYNWLLRRKGAHIKSRLRDESITIQSIVAEFGFSSASHLNSFCKKQLNGTPMEIRRKLISKQP